VLNQGEGDDVGLIIRPGNAYLPVRSQSAAELSQAFGRTSCLTCRFLALSTQLDPPNVEIDGLKIRPVSVRVRLAHSKGARSAATQASYIDYVRGRFIAASARRVAGQRWRRRNAS
jgi:hypothetical protein